MFNIVLVNPQIPPNTGNIGRLCVNAGAVLHLVKPLGFEIDEKSLKRAGLDYWQKLDVRIWESLDEVLESIDLNRAYFATTKSKKPYFEARFEKGDYIFFGSETEGLPQKLLEKAGKRAITIPMCEQGRSINLAVSVGIILYEGIRQNFGEFCR